MHFSSIVRKWCRTYRPMLDNPDNGNRRFYMTDSVAGVVELAKKITNKLSPCVIMESGVEAYVDGGRICRNYPLYFFVRAKDMADGDKAAEAMEEAWVHAQNFLTWLRVLHENDTTEGLDYYRINMESNMEVQSFGPIENGWFAALLQIERFESLSLCNNEDLYIGQ